MWKEILKYNPSCIPVIRKNKDSKKLSYFIAISIQLEFVIFTKIIDLRSRGRQSTYIHGRTLNFGNILFTKAAVPNIQKLEIKNNK